MPFKEKRACIYQIKNNKTQDFYIGQTTHFHKRKSQHFGELRLGKHTNSYMQESWKEYGESSFSFEPIEFIYCTYSKECLSEYLLLREKYYIEQLRPTFNADLSLSKLGYITSEETRKKISQSNMGKKRTDAQKRSMALKKTNNQIVEGFDTTGHKIGEWISPRYAAKSLGIKRRNISNILNGWAEKTRTGLSFKYKKYSNE